MSLPNLLDEQRRYAREARRQRYMLKDKSRAAHYAYKAMAVHALIQLELTDQVRRIDR